MSRRWSWGPLPSRLLTDPRVARMPLSRRGVLMSAYCGFDEYGRATYDEFTLRVALGIVDGSEVLPRIDALVAEGLMLRYRAEGGEYLQIARFDEDDTSGSYNRRPTSLIPAWSGDESDLIRPPIDSQSTGNLPARAGQDRVRPGGANRLPIDSEYTLSRATRPNLTRPDLRGEDPTPTAPEQPPSMTQEELDEIAEVEAMARRLELIRAKEAFGREEAGLEPVAAALGKVLK